MDGVGREELVTQEVEVRGQQVVEGMERVAWLD